MVRTLVLAAVAALVLAGCGGADDAEEEAAIAAARAAYVKAKAEGEDLSSGPCLGTILPNWVADVAHDPRQDVDDRPEDQCEAYRSGEAEHFVELDPDGNVIRAE